MRAATMSDVQPVRHEGMQCPVCQSDLMMSERLGVEIDYCPKCRGVWLDRGELDKIIAMSERQASPVPPAPSASPGFLPPQPQGAPWAPAYPPPGGHYDTHDRGYGHGGDHGGGHGGGHDMDRGGLLGRLFR